SVQRSVYKDLVMLLQKDSFLSVAQLKCKGELSFAQDCLVEGGVQSQMTNGTNYREVRQFRTDHHLVRFYFLTRIYSGYMESILADFRAGPQPDVLVVNSCVWDVSRYGPNSMSEYVENLQTFFRKLKETLLPECLVLWSLAMPLGRRLTGGFLVPEVQHLSQTLRHDVIEANFYSAALADRHGFDVLDLHFHFRRRLQHRTGDGVHWGPAAHRHISCLLLRHVAEAWGVRLPDGDAGDTERATGALPFNILPFYQPNLDPASGSGLPGGEEKRLQSSGASRQGLPLRMNAFRYDGPVSDPNSRCQNLAFRYGTCNKESSFNPFFYEDTLLVGTASGPQFVTGYMSFEEKYRQAMCCPAKLDHFQMLPCMPLPCGLSGEAGRLGC
ncbi:PED1A protein, partial [Atractosteus spatula]|nr:PED1A protein [Atractosteus spatula]